MLFLIQMIRNRLARKLNIVAYLTAENLALRHQLIVLKRNQNRPQLDERDRVFWKGLSNIWPSWRERTSISDRLVELPRVGGLHHRYEWQEAA